MEFRGPELRFSPENVSLLEKHVDFLLKSQIDAWYFHNCDSLQHKRHHLMYFCLSILTVSLAFSVLCESWWKQASCQETTGSVKEKKERSLQSFTQVLYWTCHLHTSTYIMCKSYCAVFTGAHRLEINHLAGTFFCIEMLIYSKMS